MTSLKSFVRRSANLYIITLSLVPQSFPSLRRLCCVLYKRRQPTLGDRPCSIQKNSNKLTSESANCAIKRLRMVKKYDIL